MSKITAPRLSEMKRQGLKIAALTAYDAPSAQWLDDGGMDVALVGDSVANVRLGYENTLPVTVTEMLHHVKAVRRGLKNALLVADMPFMSYEADPIKAAQTAGLFVKEGGAEAVKLEGGAEMIESVKAVLRANIPVMGHLGLTPQSIHRLGGYRIQGRRPEDARKIVSDALLLESAGVFAIVLECVPAELAAEISGLLKIPTIGIGAGARCDGQILVIDDMLGLSAQSPRFVKRYAELREAALLAIEAYGRDVRDNSFPAEDHSYAAAPPADTPHLR